MQLEMEDGRGVVDEIVMQYHRLRTVAFLV